MANDLTLGLDVTIDKILGLGQFDALGKKLQGVVAKAVQAGLLEGTMEGREMLRPAYGKDLIPGREKALKRLYAYGAKVESNAEKAAAADERREQNRLASEARADARRAKRQAEQLAKRKRLFEEARAAYGEYDPNSITSASELYVEATIARQALQYMTRITNRDLTTPEELRENSLYQLIDRTRANYGAGIVRKETLLGLRESQIRSELEAELGRSISDAEWEQRKQDELSGANAAQSAWLRGAKRDAAIEAERNAQRRKESAHNVSVFGELKDEVDDVTDSLSSLGSVTKSVGLILSGVSAGATMYYQSMWAQDAARNVNASNMAYYQRWENGGQIAGGALGAVVGALIGGPIGAVIGASGIGGLAGLWGNYKQKELEGVLKTVATATSSRRDFLTFGGRTGYSLGQASESAGFGSAGDLNNMRWTGQTLPGAMALGMVGEQEMLMLSMMPEYFAALMNGADASTLAQAYSTSVNRLPAQLKPLVSTSVPGGSQGMYANALDPQYATFLGHSREFALHDRYFNAVSDQVMAGSIQRSRRDLGLANTGVRKNYAQAMQGLHGDYFDMSYSSPFSGWANAMTLMGANGLLDAKGAKDTADFLTYKLNRSDLFMEALEGISRLSDAGLNLTIRVEGLGELTQQFPLGSLSGGQAVSYNIGAQ